MEPIDEQCARLEMLIGALSDLLTPSRELVAALKLRSNASATTRSELALLIEMQGSIWQCLGRIHDEVKAIKNGKRWGE